MENYFRNRLFLSEFSGWYLYTHHMENLSLNSYLAISNVLGWERLPASVAMPAIDLIISHYCYALNERYGISIDPNDAADMLTANWPANDIFGLILGAPDEVDPIQLKGFINLREDIEFFMKCGFAIENIDLNYVEEAANAETPDMK